MGARSLIVDDHISHARVPSQPHVFQIDMHWSHGTVVLLRQQNEKCINQEVCRNIEEKKPWNKIQLARATEQGVDGKAIVENG